MPTQLLTITILFADQCAVPLVDPRDPLSDVAGKLIVEPSRQRPQLLHRDTRVALSPDQRHLVAHAHRHTDIRDVDHKLIHTHTPQDRHPLPLDDHIAKV